MKPTPKATKEALAYAENILRVCYHDCSDSGDEAANHQSRFNALVDDQITIGAYLEQFCLPELAAIYKAFYDNDLKDTGYIDSVTDLAQPAVIDLPFSFSVLRPLLKLDPKHS